MLWESWRCCLDLDFLSTRHIYLYSNTAPFQPQCKVNTVQVPSHTNSSQRVKLSRYNVSSPMFHCFSKTAVFSTQVRFSCKISVNLHGLFSAWSTFHKHVVLLMVSKYLTKNLFNLEEYRFLETHSGAKQCLLLGPNTVSRPVKFFSKY